jgi:UDP-N-acetylglucosamine 4,6-dehydratase
MLGGKSVLITGGTGSFGRALVRRLLAADAPERLIVFSRDELKQWEMRRDLPAENHSCLRYFIGDVRDRERLYRAFRGVDVVIHAAALKQVDTAEYNPFEVVKTNILGSQNVVSAAIDRGVEKVVALSTDKAANPINLYGATKLAADKLVIAANNYAGVDGTRFAVVRYGNVLGSRGSVVPLFLSRRGRGAIPLTDPRMTRFWITLDQAVEFVLASLSRMRGGEIFVPKIPSMSLVEMAEALCPGCEQRVVGIRPGEKLHEVMVPADEAAHTVDLGDCYAILPAFHGWETSERMAGYGGEPVPEGFVYSSDRNDDRLDAAGLHALVARAGIVAPESRVAEEPAGEAAADAASNAVPDAAPDPAPV